MAGEGAQRRCAPALVHAYLAAAYALKGDIPHARQALAQAQTLSTNYLNLARVESASWYKNPKIRSFAEATYFTADSHSQLTSRVTVRAADRRDSRRAGNPRPIRAGRLWQ